MRVVTMKRKVDYGKNLNIRISNELMAAIDGCAKELGERTSVFVRKALANRLLDEGIMDFNDYKKVDPWLNSERAKLRKANELRKAEFEIRKAEFDRRKKSSDGRKETV